LPVTLPGRPDLQLSNVAVGAVTKNGNGSYSLPVTYTVTNGGASAAQPGWYDLGYLSPDATFDNSDNNISWSSHGSALAVNASYTSTVTMTTSNTTAAGTYTLFFKTDGHGSMVGGSNTDSGNLAESNEANNLVGVSVTLP
jgi:hypothetical protein